MGEEEVAALGDAFSRRFLLDHNAPMTLRALLDGVDALTGDEALPKRQLFLVAEGGRHRLTNPSFPLNARLVYTWSRRFSPPDILLSTVPVLDDETALLQLIAWSDVNGAFHFFERREGRWTWAGNSFTAFDPRARGKGPFDSHINGGLVMKELKEPWAHWQSMSSSIPRELLRDTDFDNHPGLSHVDGAEVLEGLVKSGVRRWTRSRIKARTASGSIDAPHELFRHLTHATSANLIGAKEAYPPRPGTMITLPPTFFLDHDMLRLVQRGLGLSTSLVPDMPVAVRAEDYVAAIEALDIGVRARNGARIAGDTHFCFVVPERAFEDVVAVDHMLREDMLSARLVLCLLMVDFANPVRSPLRESLLSHCPTDPVALGPSALNAPFVAAVEARASAGTAEAEFLDYWHSSDLVGRVRQEFSSFMEALGAHSADPDGVQNILRLGETRRMMFRTRKLNEFDATTARAAGDIGIWHMRKDGSIERSDAFV